jgi:hypothetical protein
VFHVAGTFRQAVLVKVQKEEYDICRELHCFKDLKCSKGPMYFMLLALSGRQFLFRDRKRNMTSAENCIASRR